MIKILFAANIIAAIVVSGCLESYDGTYVYSENPASNLTLYPDHTYLIYPNNPEHVWRGSYRVEGNEIVLIGILGETYPFTMQGNKLIDKDEKEWIKRR